MKKEEIQREINYIENLKSQIDVIDRGIRIGSEANAEISEKVAKQFIEGE